MKFPLALALFVCASNAFSQPHFVNGQAARAVLGQYEFTQLNPVGNRQVIGSDAGVAYDPIHNYIWEASGNLIGLSSNIYDRVLGFPVNQIPGPYADLTQFSGGTSLCQLCGYPAYVVLGQVDYLSYAPGLSQVATSNAAGSLNNPTAVATDGNYLVVVDTNNNRVLLWNSVPMSVNIPPDVVLGQADFTSVANVQNITASSFRAPQGAWVQNGKLYVADTGNSRVLIWNSIPTRNNQPADLVLGQPNFTSNTAPPLNTTTAPVAAANLLWNPISVSVSPDGTHLFVADFAYSRVLIWNTIPTSNQQAANVEIGQKDMTGSTANDIPNLCVNGVDRCEKTLSLPRFALYDGNHLFIADAGNDRVLVYNSIPQSNTASADEVIGQPDFLSDVVQPNEDVITSFVSNVSSTSTTPTPTALASDGTNLYVADPTDARILVFTPADIAISGTNVLNNASETIRQEGLILLSGSVVSGDTVTVSISVGGDSVSYTYTIKSGDTLEDVVNGTVNAINSSNSGSGDPYVTAQSSVIPNTILLFAKSSTADLNTIGYAATASNTTDITAAAAGTYLAGGTSGTLAPGSIFEIDNPSGTQSSGGLVDFPYQAADTTKPLPTVMKGPSGSSSVQVDVDGFAMPILSASPTQIVAQVPYTFESSVNGYAVDRNSLSIYVRTVRSNGAVLITNAAPASFTDANPGLFGVANAPEPRPALNAIHQPGNPSSTVTVSGTVTAGDKISVTVGSNTYTYTALSTDSLSSIAIALASIISNANDPSVTATAGASGTVILSARAAGAGGVGISVTTNTTPASGSTATETATVSTSTTCCSDSGTGLVTVGNPAQPNEIITFLATGIGNVQDSSGNIQQPAVGVPYAGAQPNSASYLINATVNGSGVTVIDAGLAAGAIGVYNVQIQMPGSLPTSGVVPVYIAQGAFISNTVTIPVGQSTSGSGAGALAVVIDSPSGNPTISSTTLNASGWAIDPNSTVNTITLSLDGNPLPAPTRVSRPDVCAGNPTAPDCQFGGTPGWSEAISLSGLSSGAHTLTVTATAANGDTLTQSQPFIVGGTAGTAVVTIDSPTPGQQITGPFTASGWALDLTSHLTSVSLLMDGVALPSPTKVNRPDVCSPYANAPDCQGGDAVGWSEPINSTSLGLGSHTLTVQARAANGDFLSQQVTFIVVNEMGLTIDTPQAGATVSGTIAVAGWATSPNGTMAPGNVTFRVDGGPAMATTAVARPDVCAAINDSYDCQHGNNKVGFTATLNTAQYANGQHTLVLQSTDSLGEHGTRSQTFVVNNTSSNMSIVIDTPGPQTETTLVGQVLLSGWASGPGTTATQVAVYIDDTLEGNAKLIARPDLCSVAPNYGGCPNGTPGWTFPLDTTLLADGSHQLQVVAYSASGPQSVSTTFNVANWSTQSPEQSVIDSPNGTVSGVVNAAGWAISVESAITSISASVDGVPVAATYGASRPDVCNAVPTAVGCPNVGWTASLDTTQLSNGQHTFTLTSRAANGQTYTIAKTFTVANGSNNILMIIDTNLSSALTSTTQISGWAGSPSAPVTSVKLALDGVVIAQSAETIARPDVCAAEPKLAGCPNANVGYSLTFNPSEYASGAHVLTVIATTSGGASSTLSRNITIGQASSTSGISIFVDSPAANATYVGSVQISGWDADSSGNSGTVTFAVDGVPVSLNVTYSARADVCAALKSSASCSQAGWSTMLDTTTLADGPHTLSITSTLGSQVSTIAHAFTVGNWSNVTPVLIVTDNPQYGAILSGTTNLSGWAYSPTGTVSGVTITIDNLILAQPASYGTSRPDVCTGMYNCPNVGWYYSLDTTILPDGVHTLSVTALSHDGGELSVNMQQSTISTSFTTRNYSF